MKIEVGKFYKTRGGQKVRVYAIDGNNTPHCIHGATQSPYGWVMYTWQFDGCYYKGYFGDDDIVAEWRDPIKLEGWINIYKSGSSEFHKSKSVADFHACKERLACKYICVEEGEGL